MSTPSTRATPERKLADFLCFAVYSANLAFGKAYRPLLDRLGLTYTQYITLICLAERDHQTVRELGRNLFLESNTLTPLLKKLEAMGYLTRRRDPNDERQVRVNLTEAGRRLREKGLTMSLVSQTRLPPEEFAKLQRAVSDLRDSLLQAADGE